MLVYSGFWNEIYFVNWKGKVSNYCIICVNEDEMYILKMISYMEVCIVVEKKICYIGVSDREKNSSFLKIFMVECD